MLLDDGAVVIVDVRCTDARIAPAGEEAVSATELNLPLGGVYVRMVRRAGSGIEPIDTIGEPGRALVFRRDEPYRVRHPLGGCDRSLVIALPEPGLAAVVESVVDRPVPAGVTAAGRRLARALDAGRIDGLSGAELAVALVRWIAAGPAGLRSRPSDRDRRLVEAVRLEIAARLGERMTLPELGRLVGLSGWELARRFRGVTGTSVHAYRTGLRVQAALERIDEGERNLTGLALDLGFADHSHLTNVVRRATGAPPSAHRRPWTPPELGAVRTILQA